MWTVGPRVRAILVGTLRRRCTCAPCVRALALLRWIGRRLSAK